jgi:hypothetical protein
LLVFHYISVSIEKLDLSEVTAFGFDEGNGIEATTPLCDGVYRHG